MRTEHGKGREVEEMKERKTELKERKKRTVSIKNILNVELNIKKKEARKKKEQILEK